MTASVSAPAHAVAAANPWAVVPPLGNLDAYITAVNRLPMLTQEEEQRFARELRDKGFGRILSLAPESL